MVVKNKIVIIGAFHEIIELAEELDFEIIGLIDFEKKDKYLNYPILANDDTVINILDKISKVPLIITPDIPLVRKRLSEIYIKYGFNFTSLISNNCKISKSVTIGKGVVVQAGVNISAQSKISDFVKLNTNCNIMHDSVIGNYTTIAPNAVILGNVKVGELCYIGSNATILPNINICDNVVIGAGALVTKNITIPGTYIGQPAIIMNYNLP